MAAPAESAVEPEVAAVIEGQAASALARPAPAFGFPVFLEVRDRLVFIAGGGRETSDKATALAALGARLRVWLPEGVDTGAYEGSTGELVRGDFAPEMLTGALFAMVGTGDRALDRRIATVARERGVLVNTIDDVEHCDFSAPAILRRGDLTVAIGTAGIAPALAVRLRDRLRGEIGPEYAELLDLFAQLRPRITASGRSFRDRRALWYSLVDGEAVDLLRDGQPEAARRTLFAAFDAWLAAGS